MIKFLRLFKNYYLGISFIGIAAFVIQVYKLLCMEKSFSPTIMHGVFQSVLPARFVRNLSFFPVQRY